MKGLLRTAATVAVVCLMVLGMITLSERRGETPGFHSPTLLVDEIRPLPPDWVAGK
jgi:hypothetical protein